MSKALRVIYNWVASAAFRDTPIEVVERFEGGAREEVIEKARKKVSELEKSDRSSDENIYAIEYGADDDVALTTVLKINGRELSFEVIDDAPRRFAIVCAWVDNVNGDRGSPHVIATPDLVADAITLGEKLTSIIWKYAEDRDKLRKRVLARAVKFAEEVGAGALSVDIDSQYKRLLSTDIDTWYRVLGFDHKVTVMVA